MHTASLRLAALAATLVFSSGGVRGAASASPKRVVKVARATLGPGALRFGRSIGSPTEGHLVGGMHLDDASYIRVIPADAAGDVRWGIEPLVMMLDRASRAVRRKFPEAITSVGHLSREGGGELEKHRSHESGRDADIAFFVQGATGRPLLETHFVPFRGDGSAEGWPGAHFDDAKNWAFVAAMLGDPEAHVTHIFVAAPLRARLLAFAERSGVAASLRMRAAEVMQQPHGALPHDDHFHVRIGCPAHMSGCVENPPMRSHSNGAMLARGRRAPLAHGLFTPAPHRALPSLPSTSPTLAAPSTAPTQPRSPTSEPVGEPSPPASIGAAVDDVDG